MYRIISVIATVAAMATLIASPAFALGNELLRINGHGNWYYAETDGNGYSGGEEDGSYDNADFTLSFAATPTENTRVFIQPFWGLSEEGSEATIDLGFGEYRHSDALSFRIGLIRPPIGLYTEIFEVGTLRPFMTLPRGVYSEGAGIIGEVFKGVGLSGEFFGDSGWGLAYDAFGGDLELEVEGIEAGEEGEGAEEGEEEGAFLHNAIGGRLMVHTPLAGFHFGVSAYTGELKTEEDGGELDGSTETTYGFHAEYLSEAISLRGEYYHLDAEDAFDTDAAYAEAAYMVTKNLQLAVRYDWSDSSLADEEEAEELPSSLTEHEDLSLGINWWFNANFVIKLSYHMVEGNRFAHPEEESDEGLDTDTNTFVIGTSFSF